MGLVFRIVKMRWVGVNLFFILESGGGVGTNEAGATESLGLNTFPKSV